MKRLRCAINVVKVRAAIGGTPRDKWKDLKPCPQFARSPTIALPQISPVRPYTGDAPHPAQSEDSPARAEHFEDVTRASQEASEGEVLQSKDTPSPSWLRDFVRDIPEARPLCETFPGACIVLRGGVPPPILNKARICGRVYTRTRTYTRECAQAHARLTWFNMKPVRVSNRQRGNC